MGQSEHWKDVSDGFELGVFEVSLIGCSLFCFAGVADTLGCSIRDALCTVLSWRWRECLRKNGFWQYEHSYDFAGSALGSSDGSATSVGDVLGGGGSLSPVGVVLFDSRGVDGAAL